MRLHDFFDYHAREQPDAAFAHFAGRTLTWEEARRGAHRIANALVRSGIEPGERVAILAKNCPEYLLFYYAASKSGAVPVPPNSMPMQGEFRLGPGLDQHLSQALLDGPRPDVTQVGALPSSAGSGGG